ncbi:hypothetical protein TREES_T100001942 [Tupaia chinensis]|uniref:Uncharacterized protein n=1 Tax=Tupaia chinensis TaxID=246437 RepID=L9JCH1_TUPCH|nr:hypothetical protein TREES_T100001942 [Tupaia chinensis]
MCERGSPLPARCFGQRAAPRWACLWVPGKTGTTEKLVSHIQGAELSVPLCECGPSVQTIGRRHARSLAAAWQGKGRDDKETSQKAAAVRSSGGFDVAVWQHDNRQLASGVKNGVATHSCCSFLSLKASDGDSREWPALAAGHVELPSIQKGSDSKPRTTKAAPLAARLAATPGHLFQGCLCAKQRRKPLLGTDVEETLQMDVDSRTPAVGRVSFYTERQEQPCCSNASSALHLFGLDKPGVYNVAFITKHLRITGCHI